MLNKILKFHLILLIFSLVLTGDLASDRFECLLESNKYSHEFLYSKSNMDNNVYTISSNDLSMLKWSLTQLTGTYDLYTIRYVNTNEYLCGTDMFEENLKIQDITNDLIRKRLVHTRKIDKFVNFKDDCIWRFERAHTDKGFISYFIWNVYYNESLYAASYLFKPNRKLRKTFLLNKMSKKMNEFKWIPECNY
jgi:hypothetical protein